MIDINTEIKSAMLKKEVLHLAVLRALKSEISKFLSMKGRGDKPLTQDEEWAIIRKEIGKRNESIEAYKKVDAADALAKELREKSILELYLPEPLTTEELNSSISFAIAYTQAETKKDIGKVNACLSSNVALRGRYDTKEASRIIASLLK